MNLLEDIIEDIEWRKTQLLIVKTLPFLHNFSTDHKEFLIKHSVPTVYAIWEGFIQNAFQIYIRELNKLGLARNEFCLNIFTHSFDSSFPQLKEYPNEFAKKMALISKFDNYISDDFRINPKIDTESNVGLNVLNRICLRFNLEPLPNYPYKQNLNDLLMFRNRVAHGDISFVINQANVDEFKDRIDGFIGVVEDLMAKVHDRMFNAFNIEKSYKRS